MDSTYYYLNIWLLWVLGTLMLKLYCSAGSSHYIEYWGLCNAWALDDVSWWSSLLNYIIIYLHYVQSEHFLKTFTLLCLHITSGSRALLFTHTKRVKQYRYYYHLVVVLYSALVEVGLVLYRFCRKKGVYMDLRPWHSINMIHWCSGCVTYLFT